MDVLRCSKPSKLYDLASPLVWPMTHSAKTIEDREKENQEDENIVNVHDEEEGEEEEVKARCEWDISLSAAVTSISRGLSGSDALGAVEIDPSGRHVATGGMGRKIRLYGLTALLNGASSSDLCICTPAKLSSLKWRPGSASSIIGSGDYDGVVTEHDLETRAVVSERDEHGGRRVWSVDYTLSFGSTLGTSGSDDGTVHLWDASCEPRKSVEIIRPGGLFSSVCSVEFDPYGGPFLAVGCADRKGYIYDVRKTVDPVSVLEGHTRTVSYVRFAGSNRVATAGTDGCLKLWDLSHSRAVRTYRGHVNRRNFVGLSVWRDGGLLGCGSEDSGVFVYDTRWTEPVWVNRKQTVVGTGGFVSSVCWRQAWEDRCTLVAGGSDGVLQVFTGNRKS